MLNRLFTRLFTPSLALQRRMRETILTLNAHTDAIDAHTKLIRKLQEDLEELTSAHRKLRGRFYASPPEDSKRPSNGRLTPAEKSALLAAHGLHGAGVNLKG